MKRREFLLWMTLPDSGFVNSMWEMKITEFKMAALFSQFSGIFRAPRPRHTSLVCWGVWSCFKNSPSPLIKAFRERFYNYFLGMWLCFELCNVCLLLMGIKYFPVAPSPPSLAFHLCWNSREFIPTWFICWRSKGFEIQLHLVCKYCIS